MSDYKVTDTELISVANAIRTKSGTQAQLEWPSGFVSAIGNISDCGSGSGEEGGSNNTLYLTNQDGTIGVYVSESEFKVYFNGYTKPANDVSITSLENTIDAFIILLLSSSRYSSGLVYTRAYGSDKSTNNGYIGFYNGAIRSLEDNLVSQKASTFWAVIDFLDSTVQQNNAWEEPPIVASHSDDWSALDTYIQSSGTQYIDTGYIPNENTRLELVLVPISNSSYSCLFGCCNSSSGGRFAYERSNSDGYSDLHGNTYTVVSNINSRYDNYLSKISKTMSISKIERLDGFINGVGYSDTEFTPSYNFVLFGNNTAGTVSALSKLKLYRCQIYESDTLVHEFIPWIDDNDVVCLKDTVTGNLKYNAGTGTFTYGTDS